MSKALAGLTYKLCADLEEGATGNVHQFCLSAGHVEEDVVRIDVPVQDLAAAAVPHSLQHMVEQPLHSLPTGMPA